MKIVNQLIINKFMAKHAASRIPLTDWMIKTEAAKWGSLTDIKGTFNSADYKTPFTVFNIGGNNFRILTTVAFPAQTVTVNKIGTHAEYAKWKL